MNVTISVLGESYDLEQERAQVSFYESRALICLELFPRMWKVSRPISLYRVLAKGPEKCEHSQVQALIWSGMALPLLPIYFLIRSFACEHHVFNYHGNHGTAPQRAPYLWSVAPPACAGAGACTGG